VTGGPRGCDEAGVGVDRRALVLAGLWSPLLIAAKRPPRVALVELRVGGTNVHGVALKRRVRVAHPKGWTGDFDADRRAIRLLGPEGEGEILVATVAHPAELGAYLDELRVRHPSAAPSPPQAAKVHGVDPLKDERATRFVITGQEVGEMMMIERGGIIVLFAAVVRPEDWPAIAEQLERCYPTVEVVDDAAR